MTDTLPNEAHPTGTDVVARPTPPKYAVSVGVPLRTLDEAWRLAQALAVSSAVPYQMRGKASDVLAVLLWGAELGIGAMGAVQTIAPINGKPTISARLWLALLRRAGHRAEVVEQVHAESCSVRITRGDTGEVHTAEYTIEEAIAAHLVRREPDGTLTARSAKNEPLPWEKHTDDMLLARAVSRAARFIAPEVAMGFYVTGEIDHADEDAPPVKATATVEVPTSVDGEVVDAGLTAAEVAAVAEEFADITDADVVEAPAEPPPVAPEDAPDIDRLGEPPANADLFSDGAE